MFRITKEFHFSASHQLCAMPDDHPCARLHGHNYIVELELSAAELDENGFVCSATITLAGSDNHLGRWG